MRRGIKKIEPILAEPIDDEVIDGTPSMNNDVMSLEELGRVYAEMLAETQATVPTPKVESSHSLASPHLPNNERPHVRSNEFYSQEIDSDHDQVSNTAITAERIVEALLFVGTADRRAIDAASLANVMRGVEENEIDEIVDRLNTLYASTSRVMRIAKTADGYQMRIAEGLEPTENRVRVKLQESKLPPMAIDCLAIVAYRPGSTRDEVELLWNRPAGILLTTLVRKELLRVEKSMIDGKSVNRYHPTERFLNLVGLASLNDLPQVDSDL